MCTSTSIIDKDVLHYYCDALGHWYHAVRHVVLVSVLVLVCYGEGINNRVLCQRIGHGVLYSLSHFVFYVIVLRCKPETALVTHIQLVDVSFGLAGRHVSQSLKEFFQLQRCIRHFGSRA